MGCQIIINNLIQYMKFLVTIINVEFLQVMLIQINDEEYFKYYLVDNG